MIRLMEHYQDVCRRRLRLWSCPATVTLNCELNQLVVRAKGRDYCLQFDPRRCAWSVDSSQERIEGSFDRVTKQIRRILTTSPVEEEGR